MLDRATVRRFLELQKIKLGPKKMANLLTERRSSELSAQSAFEKQYSENIEPC